jgi:obg-like ATPase 1
LRFEKWEDKEVEALNKFNLLSTKPLTYLINMSKKNYLEKNCKYLPEIQDWIKEKGGDSYMIPYSAIYEKEIDGK